MKKFLILIILLSLFGLSTLLAHEASIHTPIIVPDEQADEDGGWNVDYVGLGWSATNDYCADFNLTPIILNSDAKLVVNRAWKQLKVCKYFDVRFGKDQLAFGRLASGKPSKNLQYYGLPVAPADLMFKILGDFAGLGWSFYYANTDGDGLAWVAADIGGRFTYNLACGKLGAAFLIDNTSVGGSDPEGVTQWEFDFDISILGKANVAGQLTNEDDDNDETDDMELYAFLHYIPGFDVPICGKVTPYLGYITKRDPDSNDGMGDNNIIIGVNIKPMDNGFMKIEYNIDSVEDVDPTLDLQVGFTF